ncbi:hypothetical protein CONLIGDRAFT_14605 [Coniochaeta ligniaria NRRL 30616]|uniref:Uncharacterized protein n=1 Tax=Coniochaeta ligniaria NRRL 30616 TaxID=1408157 RepID=A0A1J7JMM4_9PEZI|nr:hypothetical protein CONLIGDRAFT_14605 [Coniochaeta ligniaria NRRL 30616]
MSCGAKKWKKVKVCQISSVWKRAYQNRDLCKLSRPLRVAMQSPESEPRQASKVAASQTAAESVSFPCERWDGTHPVSGLTCRMQTCCRAPLTACACPLLIGAPSFSTTGFAHVFSTARLADTLLSPLDIYISFDSYPFLRISNQRTSIGYFRLDIRCGSDQQRLASVQRLGSG